LVLAISFRIVDNTAGDSLLPSWRIAVMRRVYLSLLGLLVLTWVLGFSVNDSPAPAAARSEGPVEGTDRVHTFSIAAYDPDKKEWGVAVASKYLAVGAVVPWAKAKVGAVATQAAVNVTYGENGLKLLAEGKSAEEVIKNLTGADRGKEFRQLGIVDAKGKVAHFTGKNCNAYAGAKAGKHYTCQGNLLAGKEVIEAMAKAFEGAKGRLAWRLMAALEAGEKAGGDKRGKQSAAILVVRENGGPNGMGDRAFDFRVDDHKTPVQELGRILTLALKRPADSTPK
jgi:uncharacterized Ntn-hydrolase superfamily protein